MDPIWAPHVIQDVDDTELDLYIDFSSTACVLGGGCSVDEALNVLYQSNGDIKVAMEKLLTNYKSSTWTEEEVQSFERLFKVNGKNFLKISQDLGSKSVKDCVLFYYKWKKTRTIKPPEPSGSTDQFPCKVCGRIFPKVKSRSAHMKRHKNER